MASKLKKKKSCIVSVINMDTRLDFEIAQLEIVFKSNLDNTTLA